MQLIKEIIIRDILDYETSQDINILKELEQCETFILLDLIRLGNKCNEDEAQVILEKALNEMELQDIIKNIAECLIGKRTNENEETVEQTEYKNFSDILLEFFTQLQSVDETLVFSDFINMSTQFMYRYADGVQKRYINKRNSQLRDEFENAGIFLGALTGKMDKPPQLDENGKLKKESLRDKILAIKNSRGGRE